MATYQATMTNRQTLPIGVTILDQDGQPITTLPEGASITFTSDDPDVCGVVVREDGMNADITSGKVGIASITIHATGTPELDGLGDDVIQVRVTNSKPGQLNTTVGVPVAEPGTEDEPV